MRPRLHPGLQVVATLALVGSSLLQPAGHATQTAVQILAASAGSSRQAAARRIDADRLVEDVQALSAPEFEGRLTGSAGNRRAQSFILSRFKQLKLQTVNGSHEQRFSFTEPRRTATREFREATNLVSMIPGRTDRDDFILVTAHYDHLGIRDGQIYHGADDNASGVAAMLSIAGWFAVNPPARSLVFVAFDGEEQGLQGSKYFVANPPIDLKRVLAVVNLDMVARGDHNVLYVAGTSHYPALKATVGDIAIGRGITVAFGHDRPGKPGEEDWSQSSDHGPFHAAGIPFLFFSVEDHRDYHRPTDTADKIPLAFYREASEVALETVRRFSERPPIPRSRPASGGGPLSPQEQAIVDAVRSGNASALALLERAVNINSGSMNFEGVRAVGQVFRTELDTLGFITRWLDGAPFNRAGHLVAERRGTGPRVLLIGHLDTVFEPASRFQRYERIDDTTARGPGIIDMKGGNVVMVHALKALKAAGTLDRLQLTVVMTGDEELSGEPLNVARAALIESAKGADIALGFEDGPGDPRSAVIARRGAIGWRLRVTAKPAHSSQVFRTDIGYGAIFEAARILDSFREQLAGERHLTFNPGVFLGGTSVDLDTEHGRGTAVGKENVIAEHAVVMGDLRSLSLDQLEAAKTRMTQIVAQSLPHAQATIAFDEGYPPLAPTDANRRLLALYDQASRDVGAGPVTAVDPDRAGAADVSFVAGHAKMILDGIGLMGHSDHTTQETADLSTLPTQTMRAAILLYRISQGAIQP